MDERKIVKVIDEHDIDRTANIMCSIDVDGSDYVIYSIKRDEDNDNLFVSKLIKNNDGTSNMVNIEDTMEKGKLVDIVKELVTYSINSDADKTTGVVNLPSGKEIKISNVLINREQNINVGKTYITTVKRSVTKVGNNFYSVEFPSTEPVIEPVFETPSVNDNVFPELSAVSESTSVPESVVEPTLPEMPSVETPVVSEPIQTIPEELNIPTTMENIIPETPVVTQEVQTKTNIINNGFETSTPIVEATQPVSEPVIPSVEVSQPMPEPVIPSFEVSQPVPEPIVNAPSEPLNDDRLVFDGSKESNLNVVLGEVSKDNIIPTPDVTPIREFGQDEVAPVAPAPVASENTELPVGSTDKAGFANNKFFMVVAIAFFLAACVFLGYEVFRYFKLVG